MNKRQKSLLSRSLHSSTFQPKENLVKTEAHFPAMQLLLTYFSWLYFEFIRITRVYYGRTPLSHDLCLYPSVPKLPSNFYLPGLETTLTSCSWFSNILHQTPIGRKHLMRKIGHGDNQGYLVCFCSYHTFPGQHSEGF